MHKICFEWPEETRIAIFGQSSRWVQPAQKTLPSAEKNNLIPTLKMGAVCPSKPLGPNYKLQL